MKQISLKRTVAVLRISAIAFVSAVLSLFLFSFTVSSRLTADIWKQLGISQQQGVDKIKTGFLNNYLDAYGIRNAKNIATGNRAAIAKDLLTFTKQYINGATFKKEYDKERALAKPEAPPANHKTKEEVRNEKVKEMQESIAKSEETMKKMDAQYKPMMQKGIDDQKKTLKEYEAPNNKIIEIYYQGEVMDHKRLVDRYNENMKQWEKNYPENHKDMIKARLQRYLSIAGTVDFDAELVEKRGKKYFVKADYERKNDEWKMIFRAGKEVYEVTKSFAENWVKEL